MAEKAKHAFGSSSNIEQALQNNAIDSFDILFLDGDTDNPKIGWVDKDGKSVIVNTQGVIYVEGEALPETGEKGKIYIFGKSGYFYDGTEFVNLCKPVDLAELETQVDELETQIGTKVDADTVQNMIEEHSSADVIEVVEF